MKVWIDKSEWYPVYVLYSEDNHPSWTTDYGLLEVDDKLAKRIMRVQKEFDKIQDIVQKMVENEPFEA